MRLLKQQSADRNVTPLIILIPSQPNFAVILKCLELSEEAGHANFIVFDLTWLGLEPAIYRTPGEQS